jgi:hypothetical protein
MEGAIMIRQRLHRLEKQARQADPTLCRDGYPECTVCHGTHRHVVDLRGGQSEFNATETSPYCPACGRPAALQDSIRVVFLPIGDEKGNAGAA